MGSFKGQHKNKDLGTRGETLAEAYLIRHGWSIRVKNWRSHPYEIDLVAQK
ncbi:MAG: YraN family protein, partial [Bacteroidota bacterium]